MDPVRGLDVEVATEHLRARGGGYEVVHTSPGLEIGVYVLIAPEPDSQEPHVSDEVYIVLAGRGEIDVDGDRRPIGPGQTIFVPAGAQHRFHDDGELILLVVFNGPESQREDQTTL